MAIRNTTLPRLVAKDVPTVQVILWDLFHMPDSKSRDDSYTKLNVSVIMRNYGSFKVQ